MTSSAPSHSFNLLAFLSATLRFNVLLWIFVFSSINALPFSDNVPSKGRATEDRFWVAQYDKNNQIAFQRVSSVRQKPGVGGLNDDYTASAESKEKLEETWDTDLLRGGFKGKPTQTINNLVISTVVPVTKVKRTLFRRKRTKVPSAPTNPALLSRPLLLAQLNAVLGDITAIAQNCL